MREQIALCRKQIEDERARAAAAGSVEAAELHVQLAELYEIQLGILNEHATQNADHEPARAARPRRTFGELLARIA